MHDFKRLTAVLTILLSACGFAAADTLTFRVTVDRGTDRGQSFGSLFEVASQDGAVVIGAGFQNAYNTYYRADRHAVQFFVRPADRQRQVDVQSLPRPNTLCGTYFYSRDDVVHSTYGGVRAWDAAENRWQARPDIGGTGETMRVASGVLEFGDNAVKYEGRTILSKPAEGSYQLFFYAHGQLCFYHVNRRDGAYRAFANEQDGYSKLYACPWTPEESHVDLSRAVVHTLPVVGETTFAWGVLGRQIITGSNVGGFYIFEEGRWRMSQAPDLNVSNQHYSTLAFHDRLLMGHYPTGRLFEYDGKLLTEKPLSPPLPNGVSGSAREAQTTVIYGGEVFVGVWPWGELWRYHPDSRQWALQQRIFSHPEVSASVVHPYDVENRGHAVSNLWGQRITSLVTSGSGLFLATSAKVPCEWQPDDFPFLAPDKWKSYGSVYRLTMPGHLGAETAWTAGPTTFEFSLRDGEMTIAQDGKQLAATRLAGTLADTVRSAKELKPTQWGGGIYGEFTGPSIQGAILR